MTRTQVLKSAAVALTLCIWFSPRPATMAADEPAKIDNKDKKFVMEAATGGMTEVKLGEVAQKNAASDDVKKFGEMMVTDHTKANTELTQIAQTKGITIPSDVDEKDQKLIDKLAKLQGADFDKAYMKEMVKDHNKDLKEFKTEAKDGEDAEIKAFADKTVPTIEHHLDSAKETSKNLSGHASANAENPK